jgi:choline dehydrogenase
MVKTNYHPAGTARMGPDGEYMAVLDAAMRVRGVDNLRVADMSACPNINSGNTAAPAMMLGDRCASFILGDQMDASGGNAASEVRHLA